MMDPIRLPPFVLALISIVLLGLVALMITVFYRAFSRGRPRRPLGSDAREGQSDAVHIWALLTSLSDQPTNPVTHYDVIPATVLPTFARGLAGLRPPEASVTRELTRGTVVVFFQNAYTGLHHHFSASNYPSTQALRGWLPRSYPVGNNGLNSMA